MKTIMSILTAVCMFASTNAMACEKQSSTELSGYLADNSFPLSMSKEFTVEGADEIITHHTRPDYEFVVIVYDDKSKQSGCIILDTLNPSSKIELLFDPGTFEV